MIEAAPYASLVEAIPDIELLSRVLGMPPRDVALRVIEAGIDAVLADADVRELVERMRALDTRRAGAAGRGEGAAGGQRSTVPPAAGRAAARSDAEETDAPTEESGGAPRCDGDGDDTHLSEGERARIGALLKAARERRGLSQQEVAEQILLSTRMVISRIELGQKKVAASLYARAEQWATAAHPLDVEPKRHYHESRRRTPAVSLGRARFKPSTDAPAPDTERLSAAERARIGLAVRQARSASGLSQRSLAEQLGMSHALLSIIERGDEGAGAGKYRHAEEWARKGVRRATPAIYACPPLRARLTLEACKRNKRLAKDAENPNRGGLEACLQCPGVVKLAERTT